MKTPVERAILPSLAKAQSPRIRESTLLMIRVVDGNPGTRRPVERERLRMIRRTLGCRRSGRALDRCSFAIDRGRGRSASSFAQNTEKKKRCGETHGDGLKFNPKARATSQLGQRPGNRPSRTKPYRK